ncbi:MAG: flagellar basal body-associated FliL family protein [bacterium]|jgi:flagellar FliL protein|nr:flagellar basal body-associated FliL family protein [candidate division KSB1 bacterium]MDH7559336.1 flagellar basal body-associated FliL family protein [bacterium]
MNAPDGGDELILEQRGGVRAGSDADPEVPKTGKGKGLVSKLLIGLGLLGLQAGLAYAIMMLVVLPAAQKRASAPQVKQETVQPAKEEKKNRQTPAESVPQSLADMRIESLFALEDVVINPAFSGGERYLVLSLVFISDTKETQKEIEQKLPLIQDNLNTLLSQKGVWWYSNSENREALREEIRVAVNELLRTGKVTRVLFTKYVIQ